MNSVQQTPTRDEIGFDALLAVANSADASKTEKMSSKANHHPKTSELQTIDPALIDPEARSLAELVGSTDGIERRASDFELLSQEAEEFKRIIRRQVASDLFLAEQKRRAAAMAERIAAVNRANQRGGNSIPVERRCSVYSFDGRNVFVPGNMPPRYGSVGSGSQVLISPGNSAIVTGKAETRSWLSDVTGDEGDHIAQTLC